MVLKCIISYVAPDGEKYEAGKVYTVDEERGAFLLAGAAGQFVVEAGSTADKKLGAPAGDWLGRQDKPIEEPPAGGAPVSRKR